MGNVVWLLPVIVLWAVILVLFLNAWLDETFNVHFIPRFLPWKPPK